MKQMMNKSALAFFGIWLLLFYWLSVAHAQPLLANDGYQLNDQIAMNLSLPDKENLIEEKLKTRSPGLAVGLSVGITAALVGGGIGLTQIEEVKGLGGTLIGIGALLGPSIGSFYNGEWGRGLLFSLGRGASVGLMVWGITGGIGCHHDCSGFAPQFYIGAIGLAGLALWEFIDVYYGAIRFNEAQHQKKFAITPIVIPPPTNLEKDASAAMGLGFSGTF